MMHYHVHRLEALIPALIARVRDLAPEATAHLEELSDGYFCVSWGLHCGAGHPGGL